MKINLKIKTVVGLVGLLLLVVVSSYIWIMVNAHRKAFEKSAKNVCTPYVAATSDMIAWGQEDDFGEDHFEKLQTVGEIILIRLTKGDKELYQYRKSGMDESPHLTFHFPVGEGEALADLEIHYDTAALRAENRLSMMLGGLIVLFILLIVIGTQISIVAPLVALAQANKKVGDGDLSVSVPPASMGFKEVHFVTESFNTSVDNLKEARRQLEERALELEKLNENLEQAKKAEEEKNRQLATLNDNLTESQEKLQEFVVKLRNSNDALQSFAYSASHDLQNPLNYVIIFSKKLVDQLESEAHLDLAQKIVRHSSYMRELINGILAFSRVTTEGKEFSKVSVKSVLTEITLPCLESMIEEKSAEVVVDLEDEMVVRADKAQLARVFENLLSNAMKYTAEGTTPHIRIFMEKGTLLIKDNGIGFKMSKADAIFKLFKRLHGKKSQYKGTGVGLAICKRIMQRHGADITVVDSEPGKGSTFAIIFPEVNHE